MSQSARKGFVLGLLLAIGAAAFGTGINWGLPSSGVDAYLFPPGSYGGDSTEEFSLSGAGIEHLAGAWEEDANRGAEVAQHPIGDRSQPVVLLQNRRGLSAKQIFDRGDAGLADLYKAQQAAWDQLTETRQKSGDNSGEVLGAEQAYQKSGDAILQYVERWNDERDPTLAVSKQEDRIARARILRRYRLYSNQPDEMITFRSLAQMHPGAGDFDPRLYQYGGLWIYPVGGLLKAAGEIGLITVSSDATTYLDHPELFGPFYIVARAYSAAWGLAGIVAVVALVRRFTGSEILATAAGLCFVAMPVVLDLAHEAKPHLAGAVILMWAVVAGIKYVDEGKTRRWIWASVLCGAAGAMVLSDLVALLVIPAMVIARRERLGRALGICAAGAAIAAAVYFLANPYVGIHLLGDRRVLVSNLGNSREMYGAGPIGECLISAVRLIAIGPGAPLAIAGALGAIVLLFRRRCGVGWILAVLAIATTVPFVMGAANKPGEYARFGLVGDLALMIAAFGAVGRFVRQTALQAILGLMLIGATGLYSFAYERGFMRDASPVNSRTEAADALSQMLKGASPGIGQMLLIEAEPAPYCLPPVDLFRWKIVLLPYSDFAAYTVKPDDSINVLNPLSNPISWADKRFLFETWIFDSVMVPSTQP
ncbi:MAG: glycosyltransferase family 39 protein [Tepidisphaeraceae bacterium]